jgi:integrative and conjugative element protein (TIGR02256 family)
VLLDEAERYRVRETGGALLGWREDKEVVVNRILGPGPRARHRFWYFEPDHEWQGREGRRIYHESRRTIAYVGDWHTHPRGATRPSPQDRKAMASIANDSDFRTPNPLSLIVSRPGRCNHSFNVYVWNGKALEPIAVELFDGSAVEFAVS